MTNDSSYLALMAICVISMLILLIVATATAEPNRYTAIYIEDADQLETNIELEERYSFSFSIENHEGSTELYEYTVVLIVGGEEEVLRNGEILLEDGDRAIITQGYSIGESFEEAQIIVYVGDQEIYFSLTSA
jgi:hypothetical protein